MLPPVMNTERHISRIRVSKVHQCDGQTRDAVSVFAHVHHFVDHVTSNVVSNSKVTSV